MSSELYEHLKEVEIGEFDSVYLRHDIRLSSTPFILKYVQSILSKLPINPAVFICAEHTESFYKSLLSKLGITSFANLKFVDVLSLTVESLEELEQRVSEALCKESVIVFDNLAALVFFASSIKELLKLYLKFSNNHKCFFASPQELPIPENFSFHNFIISRCDCVIELTSIKGSTAAVGVDGKYELVCYKIWNDSSGIKNNFKSLRKTLLFKVVDRSVLLYPMGSM